MKRFSEEQTEVIVKSVIDQLDFIVKEGASFPEIILEIDCFNKVKVKKVEDCIRTIYGKYGDIVDEYFDIKYGYEYISVGATSKEELKKEIIKLVEHLDLILSLRRRCSRISSKISDYIEHKSDRCYLYLLITDTRASWGILQKEPTEDDLKEIANNKYGDVRCCAGAELIGEFYEELTEEEETWAEKPDPSEKLIYNFVIVLLHRLVKTNLFWDNMLEGYKISYKAFIELEEYLYFEPPF